MEILGHRKASWKTRLSESLLRISGCTRLFLYPLLVYTMEITICTQGRFNFFFSDPCLAYKAALVLW